MNLIKQKVRILRNKSKVFTVALVLVLTTTVTLGALPLANAHTPPWEIPTYAYLAIAPNPVGKGQPTFFVFWLHGAPPTAMGLAGDRWHDFTITVTKPDGTTKTLGPFISDPTGSAWTIYTPDQIGTYKIVFSYTGQVLTLVHPETGVAVDTKDPFFTRFPWLLDFVNDTFLPSSATEYLTVQEEPVEKIPDYPLPTEYWTRPIEGQNTAWRTIASNWLGGAHLAHPNLWQTDGVAPNSPHIMWTMPIEFGGVVGGTTEIPGVTFYSGGSYEGRFANAISMCGRLYFELPLGHSGGRGGYVCVDLRTGEVLWKRDDLGALLENGTYISAPSKGQLFNYESQNQHGVVGGVLWRVVGTTWYAYDAWTGKWAYTLTDVPSGTEVYTPKGEIVRYVLNYPRRWLALWSSTCKDQGLEAGKGTTTEAYQWRPIGKTVNMSTAYLWNVSIPDLPGLSAPSIVKVIPGDIILGTSSTFPWLGGILLVQESPITMWAISDKPETRGQLLWIKNYTLPEHITRLLGPVDPVNRVFTMTDIETMAWLGYSLDTGSELWGPVTYATRAFSYYGSGTGGGQQGFVAYGNLYTQGFGGELICYDLKKGNLLWKYNNTYSGLETVWGQYPIFIAAIADGKVYAFNNEHSPNAPYYKGERVRCIDAYTGKELWTVMGWAGQTGGPGTSTSILAEGFLAYYNYYDNQIYAIGKGPSATTVSATPTVIANGDSVLIQGTVTDQSPGAKGTPAISDASMSAWMEYLYMQKPMPTDATGVPVLLQAMCSNGTVIDIATVTSDIMGHFEYMWTPPASDTYKILATFLGSESYWMSSAQTALGVTEAPPAVEAPAYTGIDLAIIAAVVVVAILVIYTLFTVRKLRK